MFTHLFNSYFDPFDYYSAFRRPKHYLFNPFYSNNLLYAEPFLIRNDYDNELNYLLKEKLMKEQFKKMKEEKREQLEEKKEKKEKKEQQSLKKQDIFEELFETPFSNLFKSKKEDFKLASPFEELFDDKIFKKWFNPYFETQKLEQKSAETNNESQKQQIEKDRKDSLNNCDEKQKIQLEANNSNPTNKDNNELNESQVSEKQSLLKSMIEEEFNTMTSKISQPENAQSIAELNENQKDDLENEQKQFAKDVELFENDKKILKEHDFKIEENDEDDDKKWIYGSKQQKYKDNGIQEEKFYKVESKENDPKLSTQIYEKTIKNQDDHGNFEKQFIQLTTHKY